MHILKMSICCLLLVVFCFLAMTPISAQETAPAASPAAPESLRLPEVVITGSDRSKIQRLIPKVAAPAALPVLTESSRDLAEALLREGDRLYPTQPRQAEERYAQSLALDPANTRAYLRLGDACRALSKFAEAAAAYQQALTLAANLTAAHYRLGLLYETRLQNPSKAIEHYQTYLRLGGADARVKIWLRDLQRQRMP